MKKLIFIMTLVMGISISGFSQLKIHSFREAEKLSVQNPKPYFIFIKTDWCKFCKMMEKSTFQNEDVIAILNNDFYFIVLDAQSKLDIAFHGKTFKYSPSGINSGLHELASELATIDGEISYPTTIILSPDLEILGQKSGFIDSKNIVRVF